MTESHRPPIRNWIGTGDCGKFAAFFFLSADAGAGLRERRPAGLAWVAGFDAGRAAELGERLGVNPAELSPYHHVKSGAPPAIIFHGRADTTVPFATVDLFSQAMKKAGNRCELNGYEGEPHGFFNFGRGGNKAFLDTLRKTDIFLASLGYLVEAPTVEGFDWTMPR